VAGEIVVRRVTGIPTAILRSDGNLKKALAMLLLFGIM
jgi:hypothetical protein